jgi:hypothetical protein
MVPVKWRSGLRSMLRLVDLVGAGFGFRGNDGIAWVSILLLFAEPLSGVDFCLDGRGRGLRCGWGGVTAGNQSFDGNDHRKGLDLADGASGYFVAEIGQFPKYSTVSSLLHRHVLHAQPLDGPVELERHLVVVAKRHGRAPWGMHMSRQSLAVKSSVSLTGLVVLQAHLLH